MVRMKLRCLLTISVAVGASAGHRATADSAKTNQVAPPARNALPPAAAPTQVPAPKQGAHAPFRFAAVATDHDAATAVARATLEHGGNAADAAVAAAFALGVVNPTSSGIGGGGFAVVYDAKTKRTRVYDFREMAPAALDPSDFIVGGNLDEQRARRGGLAVGVPGEVAGLYQLTRNHGRLPWARVVQPAADLAAQGFTVSPFLAQAAAGVHPKLPAAAVYAPLANLLARDGKPIAAGSVLTRPALATLLTQIAADGPKAFYRGANAQQLIATVTADAGVMTEADLRNYRVVERRPLWGHWHGLRIATMPLPSSGGLVLLESLGLLDQISAIFDPLPADSAARAHLLAEVLKHGFADRARWLGDSKNAAAQSTRMLAPARLRQLAKSITQDRTLPPERYGNPGRVISADDHGTSHLCVVDGDGNAVALTTTVNGYFGAKLVTPTGVVLNNEIDDFAIAPGAANQFGLVQGAQNLVRGGKRPLSSMTPTLLFDDKGVVGCVGGSGGPLIISGTLQVILNGFGLNMTATQAVTAPRLHHQWQPNELLVQWTAQDPRVTELTQRGHVVVPQGGEAIVQYIRVVRAATKPSTSPANVPANLAPIMAPPDKDAASDPDKGGSGAAQVFEVPITKPRR